jgi:hypothetical protein
MSQRLSFVDYLESIDCLALAALAVVWTAAEATHLAPRTADENATRALIDYAEMAAHVDGSVSTRSFLRPLSC